MPLIPDRAEEPERRASRAAPPRPDAAGFAVFYEANFDAVLGFVTRRTACPQVAADLTADIFVAALQAAGQYDPRRGAPAAWLYGIARNVLASRYRGSALEQHAVARLNGHRLLDEEDIAALEARIDAERAARELVERHSGLSEPLREILDLVAVDGLTPREAAQALGLNRATVRSRLHRAKRLLRAQGPSATEHTSIPLEVVS
ncbi:RNA polymerase sigma factor [Streptomyces sp. ME03-5684b]|uniref:RNA polymerase sigma factor n=1 Tax=Streptomyces sp. ME03-5684b TaxID=3028681 RepID=UPI0029BD9482|nr:RNA polymerase sigma factor [Streptomyces sp. ME03-5684b]MDX3321205.1 RNA polymerase sigma factor [Streptomyces sp. ME03-5684b]